MILRLLLALVMMVPAALPVAAADAPLTVRIKAPLSENDVRDAYFRDLLDLALRKTEADYGPYRLQLGPTANQSRAVAGLESGQLDVIWTIPTVEREERLRPVRIPLERGLLGYRVLLIHEDDQARFRALKDLEDLKALSLGQGNDWNSADVLTENGFHVTRAPYDNLFQMLAQKRIDAFPRGLNEAWAELQTRPDLPLTVAEDLLLRYPATSYFFVAPDNTALAERLTTGLERALADGSFDHFVRNHPAHRDMLANAKLDRRRVFDIDNPLLPAATPLQRQDLWRVPGLTGDDS